MQTCKRLRKLAAANVLRNVCVRRPECKPGLQVSACSFLRSKSSLCSLQLEFAEVHAHALLVLNAAAAGLAQLTSLTLDHSRFGSLSCGVLAATFNQLSALRHLSMCARRCEEYSAPLLDRAGAELVMASLSGLSALQSLVLDGLSVSTRAAQALAESIRRLTLLTRLNPGWARVWDTATFTTVLRSLSGTKQLRVLHLRGVGRWDRSAGPGADEASESALVDTLTALTNVQQLEVHGNLEAFAAQRLAASLANKPQLESVQLGGELSDWGDDAVCELAASLQPCSQLTSLILSGLNLQLMAAGARGLLPVLCQKMQLKQLKLSRIVLDGRGSATLAAALLCTSLAGLTALELLVAPDSDILFGIAAALAVLTAVQTLEIRTSTAWTVGELGAMAAALPYLVDLRSLNLYMIQVGAAGSSVEAAASLVAAVAYLTRLTQVSMSGDLRNPPGSRSRIDVMLLPVLSTLPRLACFTSDGMCMEAETAAVLSDVLPSLQSLKTLCLEVASRQAVPAAVLLAMRSLTGLTELGLWGSVPGNCRPAEEAGLARAVAAMRNLCSLTVDMHDLERQGGSARAGPADLVCAAAQLPRLIQLRLMTATPPVASAAARCLPFAAPLRDLSIGVRCEGEDDFDSISTLLRGLIRLTRLELWCGGQGADTAEDLARCISPLSRLRDLTLGADGVEFASDLPVYLWPAAQRLTELTSFEVAVLPRRENVPCDARLAGLDELEAAIRARGGDMDVHP